MLGANRPNTFGTVMGALFVGVLLNGLTMFNVPYYAQDFIQGCLLVLTLVLTYTLARRSRHGGRVARPEAGTRAIAKSTPNHDYVDRNCHVKVVAMASIRESVRAAVIGPRSAIRNRRTRSCRPSMDRRGPAGPTPRAAVRVSLRETRRRVLLTVASAAIALGIWWLVSALGIWDPRSFPAPATSGTPSSTRSRRTTAARATSAPTSGSTCGPASGGSSTASAGRSSSACRSASRSRPGAAFGAIVEP